MVTTVLGYRKPCSCFPRCSWQMDETDSTESALCGAPQTPGGVSSVAEPSELLGHSCCLAPSAEGGVLVFLGCPRVNGHLLTSLLQGLMGPGLPSSGCAEREQGEGFSFILNKTFHLFSICVYSSPSWAGVSRQHLLGC